jgi:hypothetical protein
MNVERIVGQSPIANGPICVVDRVFGFVEGEIYVQSRCSNRVRGVGLRRSGGVVDEAPNAAARAL